MKGVKRQLKAVIVSYKLKQIKSSNMNENPNVISSNKDIYFSIELRIFENQLAIDPKIMFICYLLLINI